MKILNKFSIVSASLVLGLVLPMAALAAGPAAVNLGSAGNFVILAKTGVSTTGTTSVVGDIGLSPAAASYLTGFALNLPAASAFATSSLVTGKVYAPGYADPTPANLTTAVSNMEAAYTDAMGRTNPTSTELGAGNIGGLTLAPGLYKWSTGVTIPTDVTLSGGANDVWIFQVAQNLNISSATKVVLSGGAQAGNVYWAVAGQATLGTTSVFNGNILGQTSIVLNTGATLNGRALAQSAVTLDGNAVTVPSVTASTSSTGTSTTTTSSNNTAGAAGSYNSSNTTTSATPAVPASQVEGCAPGNLFSATSGKSCTISATPGVPATPSLNSGVQSTTKYNFGLTTLKMWSRGEAVMELQRFLNIKLNLDLAVDGKLGPKTIAVIKQWQKDHGLVADGLIGAKTKAAMQIEAEND